MVRFKLEFDIENSSDKAAVSELRRWKALIEDGQKDVCQREQKQAFLAGLYLQAALPGLAEKLAENLSSAGFAELDSFYNACCPEPGKNNRNEQQNEIQLLLQALKMDIKSLLFDIGEPRLNKDPVDSYNKDIALVQAKRFNGAPVLKDAYPDTNEKNILNFKSCGR